MKFSRYWSQVRLDFVLESFRHRCWFSTEWNEASIFALTYVTRACTCPLFSTELWSCIWQHSFQSNGLLRVYFRSTANETQATFWSIWHAANGAVIDSSPAELAENKKFHVLFFYFKFILFWLRSRKQSNEWMTKEKSKFIFTSRRFIQMLRPKHVNKKKMSENMILHVCFTDTFTDGTFSNSVFHVWICLCLSTRKFNVVNFIQRSRKYKQQQWCANVTYLQAVMQLERNWLRFFYHFLFSFGRHKITQKDKHFSSYTLRPSFRLEDWNKFLVISEFYSVKTFDGNNKPNSL